MLVDPPPSKPDNGAADGLPQDKSDKPEEPSDTISVGSMIAGQYQVLRQIGKGSFGVCFEGLDTASCTKVCIKSEKKFERPPKLIHELTLYDHYLDGVDGVPRVHWFGNTVNMNILIIQLLGNDLEDLFALCKRRFTLRTVLMLAYQMLTRIESIHNRGLIHRDIKPENFLIGPDGESNKIYVIDFGLSKLYLNEKNKHVSFSDHRQLVGTARYCSLNVHRGCEQSRRDDMESLAYVFVYFIKGSLPWQNVKYVNKKEKYQLIKKCKESMSPEQLCMGTSRVFLDYLNYCRGLEFTQEPDYQQWKQRFVDEYARITGLRHMDYVYDWMKIQNYQAQN